MEQPVAFVAHTPATPPVAPTTITTGPSAPALSTRAAPEPGGATSPTLQLRHLAEMLDLLLCALGLEHIELRIDRVLGHVHLAHPLQSIHLLRPARGEVGVAACIV